MVAASDNQYPKITLLESAAPSTPASTLGFLYEKTDGKLYFKNDAGTETELTAATTPTFVGVRARHSVAQTGIVTSTFTALSMDSEDFDSDAFHDNATNNSRLTVPTGKGGKYLITAGAIFSAHATGERQLRIRLNGATYLPPWTIAPVNSGSGNGTGLITSVTYSLVATDYVEAIVWQNSGVNMTTAVDQTISATLLGT